MVAAGRIYITDRGGNRLRFKYDQTAEEFDRDESGELIEDPDGRPYRNWRPEITRREKRPSMGT